MKLKAALFSLIFVSVLPVFAQSYDFHKLTGAGDLEIQVTAKPSKEAATSFSMVQPQRKLRPLSQTKWKNLEGKGPLKIAVIGDTGCRLKDGKAGAVYQNCLDPQSWPFYLIMKKIRAEHPDLIIHLGDYHYRENCTQGKDCQKLKSSVGYGWSPWEEDFFKPSKPGFQAAPWILARGNHESCERASQGYFLLLANQDQACLDYEEPDFIALKDLLIVNLDSSAIPEKIETESAVNEQWLQRFKAIEKWTEGKSFKNIWIVTHKPAYGLVKMGSMAAPVNLNFQKYLQSTSLKDKVQLILAGHIHVSQVLKPAQGPLQIILGNGGTQLDSFQEFISSVNSKSIGFDSIHAGTPGFGYALLERQNSDKWKISFKNQNGQVSYQCLFAPDTRTCQ